MLLILFARFTHSTVVCNRKLEEASTPRSVKTHAGNVFCDSQPWHVTFWPQNKWVSRTHLGTFLYPAASVFEIWWCGENRRTQTNEGNNLTPRLSPGLVKIQNGMDRVKLLLAWTYSACSNFIAGVIRIYCIYIQVNYRRFVLEREQGGVGGESRTESTASSSWRNKQWSAFL